MDTEDPEPVPPTVGRIVARAIALSAVICRAYIESDAGNPKAEAFRSEVLEWTRVQGALDELEPTERGLLEQPLGRADQNSRVSLSWYSEGLAILAWYLGRMDVPVYDEPVTPSAVATQVLFMEPTARVSLIQSHLRSDDEFKVQHDRHFAIHWRLREYSRTRQRMNFSELARTAWFGPLNISGTRLLDDDLAIGDAPISRVSESAYQLCLGIAQERHRAVNWLAGYDPVYSEVAVDT
jgi:hypothetical protein